LAWLISVDSKVKERPPYRVRSTLWDRGPARRPSVWPSRGPDPFLSSAGRFDQRLSAFL